MFRSCPLLLWGSLCSIPVSYTHLCTDSDRSKRTLKKKGTCSNLTAIVRSYYRCTESMVWICSVSYTHLDCFTQGHISLPERLKSASPSWWPRLPTMSAPGRTCGATRSTREQCSTSVSYTHLDVYKRQVSR